MYEKILNDFKFCELTQEYIEQTALLLNQEWPRSLNLRKENLQSTIKQNNDNDLVLPVSLILIQASINKVIGHTSINSIAVIAENSSESDNVEFENLAFLQSVIIDKDLRGKGLGKKLMELSENYLWDYGKQGKKNTNSNYMYLTTKDKQFFYEALGYVKIEPIKFYSVKANKCTEIMKRLYSKKNEIENPVDKINSRISNTEVISVISSSSLIPLPPPPPPPPISSSFSNIAIETNEPKITWYKKSLIK